jgi:hypothetical protein
MLRFVLALTAISIGASGAEEANDTSEYRPPTGFGGYAWDTPLGEFQRLVPDPVYVRIAHSEGVIKEFDFDCFQDVGVRSMCSETEGMGFHALAEYFVDGQGFRIADPKKPGKAVLFPITYQFCAQWSGFSGKLDGDALQRLRLCGARLHFRSETALQEQAIRDPEYVTAADRILRWLVANHGEPEGYDLKGAVYVGLADVPREIRERKSRHDNWYWCNPKVDEPTPRCSASVVYTFDSETGRGQVILLTPAVWMYAYARRFGGSEDDPLYRVLHGNLQLASVRHNCTGTFLCDPPAPKAMTEAMLARFRLPAKEK